MKPSELADLALSKRGLGWHNKADNALRELEAERNSIAKRCDELERQASDAKEKTRNARDEYATALRELEAKAATQHDQIEGLEVQLGEANDEVKRLREVLESAPPIGSYQGRRMANPDAYKMWRCGPRAEALRGEVSQEPER